MAYIAIHEGEKKGAFEVPFQTDAQCRECGERMRVWRESVDGRARHFKHISEMAGGGSSGGGGNCSGGEGDEHRKWKNFAAERLSEVFDDVADASVEKRLAAPYTDKKHRDADAIVMFNERDEQLGLGLAVEVQHKNKDKDIEGTTRDYLKQDIAVAWLYEEDFSDDGCRMQEVDFRDRASDGISPLYFSTTPVPWHLHVETHVETTLDRIRNDPTSLNVENCDYEITEAEKHVPAKIPQDWFDEKSREIWENQTWLRLFPECVRGAGSGRGYIHPPEYESGRYIDGVLSEHTAIVPADLPREWYDTAAQKIWRSIDWEDLFEVPDSEKYRLQAAIPQIVRTPVHQVRFPPDMVDEFAYRTSAWGDLFDDGAVSDVFEDTGRVEIDIEWWDVFPESLVKKWLRDGDKQTKMFSLTCPGCGKPKEHISTQAKQIGIHCSCGVTFTVDIPARKVDESWAR